MLPLPGLSNRSCSSDPEHWNRAENPGFTSTIAAAVLSSKWRTRLRPVAEPRGFERGRRGGLRHPRAVSRGRRERLSRGAPRRENARGRGLSARREARGAFASGARDEPRDPSRLRRPENSRRGGRRRRSGRAGDSAAAGSRIPEDPRGAREPRRLDAVRGGAREGARVVSFGRDVRPRDVSFLRHVARGRDRAPRGRAISRRATPRRA